MRRTHQTNVGSASKRERRLLATSFAALAGVILVLVFTYLAWENTLPPLPPGPPIPAPNGYDALANALTWGNPHVDAIFSGHGGWSLRKERQLVALDPKRILAYRKALRLDYLETEADNRSKLSSFAIDCCAPFGFIRAEMEAAAQVPLADKKWNLATTRALDLLELSVRLGHCTAYTRFVRSPSIEQAGISRVLQALPALSPDEAQAAGQRLDVILSEQASAELVYHIETVAQDRYFQEAWSRRPALSLQEGWPGIARIIEWWFYPKRSAYLARDAHFREVALEMKRPFALRRTISDHGLPRMPLDAPVETFIPLPPDYVSFQITLDDTKLRLLRLKAALQEYRARHASYPVRLADLSPPKLARLADPFTGKPFVYRPNAAGYLLYSLGPDGKDDGGKPLREFSYGPNMQGDVVLRENPVGWP